MGVSSKPAEVHHMTASALSEARGHVAAIIGPQPPGSRLKSLLPRVASRLGMSERRVRAIWHGEARAIRSDEMDVLRAAAAGQAHKKASNATLTYATRLDDDAAALEARDPDFHRTEIDRLRDTARLIRRAAAGEVTR